MFPPQKKTRFMLSPIFSQFFHEIHHESQIIIQIMIHISLYYRSFSHLFPIFLGEYLLLSTADLLISTFFCCQSLVDNAQRDCWWDLRMLRWKYGGGSIVTEVPSGYVKIAIENGDL